LSERAGQELLDRKTLAFLAYQGKWLAGSWRFLTYFGRDTLLSARLLMPVLRPAAIEAALGSVLDRLSPAGEVAHEEDIGEFAALRRAAEGGAATREPIYDYKMVDDDFMLAIVAAEYLLDNAEGRERGARFLLRTRADGQRYADLLARNLELVAARATPFAQQPRWNNLVALRDGLPVGDWRDSNDGLGGGRYSYSVNASLVPAALAAAERLWQSELFSNASKATQAGKLAAAWQSAHRLFDARVSRAQAERAIRRFGKDNQLDVSEAVAALTGPVDLAALSLSAKGKPVMAMHSDEGFRLLFNRPEPAELEAIARRVRSPLPRGLWTPLGLVVANPAFIEDADWRVRFGRDRYHGTVMWSWQHALVAAGFERQLAREDLPEATRGELDAAQKALWQAIRRSDQLRQGENWSWRIRDGHWQVEHLGGFMADDEANAAQLWSTVFLAIRDPEK